MFGIKTKLKKLYRNIFIHNITNSGKVSDLMQSFQADEYGHQSKIVNSDLGYGWIHYGLIRQQKPKKILCVGSRHGYIPAVLAQACKDNKKGKVDFVDAGFDSDDEGGWTGVGYWKTLEGKNCFKDFGLDKYITLFVTTTENFRKKFPKRVYDYIYIDGDHSFKGVSLDYKLFEPSLKKGGFMAFHDVCVKGKKPEGEYGVWKLWNKLEKQHKGFKINFSGSGLGVFQK